MSLMLLAIIAAATLWVPSGRAAEPTFGIEQKRPVFAGACRGCPWGVLGEVTKRAMANYGYTVGQCYNCWGTIGPRLVADRQKPPPMAEAELDYMRDPPPDAIADFGGTSAENLENAYRGAAGYDNKPRRNLRVLAVLQQPSFLIIAATASSGITDLSEIATRRQPTFILARTDALTQDVLAHYGITKQLIESRGGTIFNPANDGEERVGRVDVIIRVGRLANAPEQRIWYEVSQQFDLNYIGLPEPMLSTLASKHHLKRAVLPVRYLRGMFREIPTVMREASYIYSRDDAPESFAYDVAKALDEHQDLFRYQSSLYTYDLRQVANSPVIPLHAGALRYYRERGYTK